MEQKDFQAVELGNEVEGRASTSPLPSREPQPWFRGREFEEPQYVLMKEEPHHRLMCMLFAQGFTPAEVAEQTGFTRVCVQNVRRQPWAREFIAKIQQEAGEKAVKNVLMGAALDAAQTLVRFATGDLDCRPVDRIGANKEILNRCFGQAPQHVKHEKVDTSELTTEELEQIAMGKRN